MFANLSVDMASPADHAADPAIHSSADNRSSLVRSHFSPWLAPLMYAIGEKLVLPAYFSRIEVIGQENIPTDGAIMLAPTHRSRWDALIVGLLGKRAGRYFRFMVTADECRGLQGWFIRRLGGFPVQVHKPSIHSLRHGVQLLQAQEALVIYPEGNIYRDRIHSLKPGLARLALRAERNQPNLQIKIIPITLAYSERCPRWRGTVEVRIGTPITVADFLNDSALAIQDAAGTDENKSGNCKLQAKRLTSHLQTVLTRLAGPKE